MRNVTIWSGCIEHCHESFIHTHTHTHVLRSCDRASWQILIIKPTIWTNFSTLFWNETLHISDSSSVHHQELFTVHSAGSGRNILILLESCLQTCMTYTIAVCTVNNSWWWTEELSETCGVSFQNRIWEIGASSWFYYKDTHIHPTLYLMLVYKCKKL
jgi:hypothetical protein